MRELKDKILAIIDINYDPDIDFIDRETIADEVIKLVGWERKYKIGEVDDPFETLKDDTV
jgi:hypothetical protein